MYHKYQGDLSLWWWYAKKYFMFIVQIIQQLGPHLFCQSHLAEIYDIL